MKSRLVIILAALSFTSPVVGETTVSYRQLVYRNDVWYGSTYWSGPDWTRVGKDWHHPGQNTPSVRRFVAPRDGRATIKGRAFKAHVDAKTDGVRLSIQHNKKEIWRKEIDGGDGKGVKVDIGVDLHRGDVIRFIVHKRGKIFCDTTRWDPMIRYATGETFQASKGFSTKTQGEHGWFFEMEVSPRVAATLPRPAFQPIHGNLAEMVEAEWRWEDRIGEDGNAWKLAIARHLQKTSDLLRDLRADRPGDFFATEATRLKQLTLQAKQTGEDLEALYLEIRRLKRHIALANPLLKIPKLLFCKRVPTSYSHEVMQYYGFRARPGGGLFVLDNPGRSLACRDILDGKLSAGNVLEPRLSYDGKRIVFSYVECGEQGLPRTVNEKSGDVGYYHLYEVNVDGTGLRQLTRGPYEDLMPTYLPDDGIVFCSTRRRSYSRCFGGQFSPRWDSYTLHRIDADGGNLRILSWNDVNEWFPAVSHSGDVLFARWDYIDRDAVTHQNLWGMHPDGANPIAVWGNATRNPHCTFQIQPIPGSRKLVFTASAHHSITAGSIVVLDPNVADDGQQGITRITPEVPFPESESRNIPEYYCAPWPLSEKYFLAAYSPMPLRFEPHANPANALGLYLIDAFGNRELLYRDPKIGSTNPCPLIPRPRPPVVASKLPRQAPLLPGASTHGQMTLADIYEGLGDVPRGSITQLRIIQIFPKTTPIANKPRIGVAGEENARAILGTVPVERDGSANFLLPAGKPVLFQALDKNGFAYQTMRSTTYVQPGELVSCIGCHERRTMTPRPRNAIALHRPPSKIDPGTLGGRPFSFVQMVQPVLDRHCVKCHNDKKADGNINLTATPLKGFTQSYWSLARDARLVPRFPARNQIQTTPPGGKFGALGSRLMQILRDGHEGAVLSDQELRTLAAWIDCNAVFYGSYDRAENEKELRGETIGMPAIQ